jgi:hypothetical protein
MSKNTVFMIERLCGRFEIPDFIGMAASLELAQEASKDFNYDIIDNPLLAEEGILITEIEVGNFSDTKYVAFYNYKGEKVTWNNT